MLDCMAQCSVHAYAAHVLLANNAIAALQNRHAVAAQTAGMRLTWLQWEICYGEVQVV
jgi:hypothetical protein